MVGIFRVQNVDASMKQVSILTYTKLSLSGNPSLGRLDAAVTLDSRIWPNEGFLGGFDE
ncbi:hypothetical protein E4U53_004001 [Claviceps sorghi]|nr:hypothetical protein E4U53_004001 [Claviceps sorghi]